MSKEELVSFTTTPIDKKDFSDVGEPEKKSVTAIVFLVILTIGLGAVLIFRMIPERRKMMSEPTIHIITNDDDANNYVSVEFDNDRSVFFIDEHRGDESHRVELPIDFMGDVVKFYIKTISSLKDKDND